MFRVTVSSSHLQILLLPKTVYNISKMKSTVKSWLSTIWTTGDQVSYLASPSLASSTSASLRSTILISSSPLAMPLSCEDCPRRRNNYSYRKATSAEILVALFAGYIPVTSPTTRDNTRIVKVNAHGKYATST